MINRIALWISLGAALLNGVAHADRVTDITDLLDNDHTIEFRALGILTLDYTLEDLFGGDIYLSDLSARMLKILDIIDDTKRIPAAEAAKVFPGGTSALRTALTNIVNDPLSDAITWRQITRKSHNKYPTFVQELAEVSANSHRLFPFTYLSNDYGYGDGEYFIVQWFLDESDFLPLVGGFRYYDLLTREACTDPVGGPCTAGSISDEVLRQEKIVQAALQLGILREPRGIAMLASQCCKMPDRICDPMSNPGCATGSTGHCTFGSYYCP